jgi:hypothetical protein
VTGGWITQADRERWQQDAVRELAAILDDCGGLPLITWTVGLGGPALAGRVNGLAPAGQVRAVFAAWRAALGLEESPERPGCGGTVLLQAGARRGMVKVRLTGAVFAEGER